jgi:hypothetical protein
MVLLLKEMLVLEAKDKEFLLNRISKVTDSREYLTIPQGTLHIIQCLLEINMATQCFTQNSS